MAMSFGVGALRSWKVVGRGVHVNIRCLAMSFGKGALRS
jgi:hypothetical protein